MVKTLPALFVIFHERPIDCPLCMEPELLIKVLIVGAACAEVKRGKRLNMMRRGVSFFISFILP